MKWFRFYTEALHHPKVQRLPPQLFKHWVNLLCLVAQEETHGEVPSVSDVAYHLKVKEPAVLNLIDQLVGLQLLDRDDDGVFVHNWDERQPRSDDAAERMRNLRRTRSEHVRTRGEVEEKREEESRGRGDGEATSAPASSLASAFDSRPTSLPRSPNLSGKWGWDGIRYAYEQNVASLQNDRERSELKRYAEGMAEEWVLAAINETHAAEKPCWAYFAKIAERCWNDNAPPSSVARSKGRQP